jgi:hypothetical protein
LHFVDASGFIEKNVERVEQLCRELFAERSKARLVGEGVFGSVHFFI